MAIEARRPSFNLTFGSCVVVISSARPPAEAALAARVSVSRIETTTSPFSRFASAVAAYRDVSAAAADETTKKRTAQSNFEDRSMGTFPRQSPLIECVHGFHERGLPESRRPAQK